MPQANKHIARWPHTTADTHECTDSHTQRDPHPQPPTIYTQPWATHRDTVISIHFQATHVCS